MDVCTGTAVFVQVRTWLCHVSGAAQKSMRKVFFPMLLCMPLSYNYFSSWCKICMITDGMRFLFMSSLFHNFSHLYFFLLIIYYCCCFSFLFFFSSSPLFTCLFYWEVSGTRPCRSLIRARTRRDLTGTIRRGARYFHPQHLVGCISCESKNPPIMPKLPNFHL